MGPDALRQKEHYVCVMRWRRGRAAPLKREMLQQTPHTRECPGGSACGSGSWHDANYIVSLRRRTARCFPKRCEHGPWCWNDAGSHMHPSQEHHCRKRSCDMTFCITGRGNLHESAAGERCHHCRPLEDENDVRTCMENMVTMSAHLLHDGNMSGTRLC